jgi:hypothetical protein
LDNNNNYSFWTCNNYLELYQSSSLQQEISQSPSSEAQKRKQVSLAEYRKCKETPSSKNSYDESNSATQMMTIQLSTENAMIINDSQDS